MEVASIREQLRLSLDSFYEARPRAAAARDKRKAAAPAADAEPAKRTLKRFK